MQMRCILCFIHSDINSKNLWILFDQFDYCPVSFICHKVCFHLNCSRSFFLWFLFAPTWTFKNKILKTNKIFKPRGWREKLQILPHLFLTAVKDILHSINLHCCCCDVPRCLLLNPLRQTSWKHFRRQINRHFRSLWGLWEKK